METLIIDFPNVLLLAFCKGHDLWLNLLDGYWWLKNEGEVQEKNEKIIITLEFSSNGVVMKVLFFEV